MWIWNKQLHTLQWFELHLSADAFCEWSAQKLKSALTGQNDRLQHFFNLQGVSGCGTGYKILLPVTPCILIQVLTKFFALTGSQGVQMSIGVWYNTRVKSDSSNKVLCDSALHLINQKRNIEGAILCRDLLGGKE